MSEHFRAFSFVDRITAVQNGSRITGTYVIPPAVPEFPTSLAAEAVGQLAAWAAMHTAGFEKRPVAGIAGKIELLGVPRPGQTLNLAVDIESVDSEAVVYGGSATIDGKPIIQLEDCMGPMIPVADLDSPAAIRERFTLLCEAGAAPEAFKGLPPLPLQRINGEPGKRAVASFQVPPAATFFEDHFPRRPVFPGSLLMQMSMELAALLAREFPPDQSHRWRPRQVLDMKLREFIPPGKCLELEANLKQRTSDSATLTIAGRSGQDIVSSARLVLAPEELA